MANRSWTTEKENLNNLYHVVFLISRNKDNQNIPDFKERKRSFFTNSISKIAREFDQFVREGQDGELCRLYISNNARDTEKVRKDLIHFLVDRDENFHFSSIEAIIAGIAAKKENALEKKWFFDFDSRKGLLEFKRDIEAIDNTTYPSAFETPNGFHVTVRHGFDTRKLMEKWGDVASLKKDDLLLMDWRRKE